MVAIELYLSLSLVAFDFVLLGAPDGLSVPVIVEVRVSLALGDVT